MNLKPETVKITIAIPVELKNSIPAEYSLTKFIVQAIREKLERDQRK